MITARKSRLTASHIVSMLKGSDERMVIEELCRRAGISSETYFPCKSKDAQSLMTAAVRAAAVR